MKNTPMKRLKTCGKNEVKIWMILNNGLSSITDEMYFIIWMSVIINEYIEKHNYVVDEYYSFLYKKIESENDNTVQKDLSEFNNDSNKKKHKRVKRKREVQKKLLDF